MRAKHCTMRMQHTISSVDTGNAQCDLTVQKCFTERVLLRIYSKLRPLKNKIAIRLGVGSTAAQINLQLS